VADEVVVASLGEMRLAWAMEQTQAAGQGQQMVFLVSRIRWESFLERFEEAGSEGDRHRSWVVHWA
jgi:hypothetical protein